LRKLSDERIKLNVEGPIFENEMDILLVQ